MQVLRESDGTGEGTVVGMAKVSFGENKNINIASYGTQPGRRGAYFRRTESPFAVSDEIVRLNLAPFFPSTLTLSASLSTL